MPAERHQPKLPKLNAPVEAPTSGIIRLVVY